MTAKTETPEEYINRSYVNYIRQIVLVWVSKKAKYNPKTKAKIWSMEKSKNYLNWLENEDNKN